MLEKSTKEMKAAVNLTQVLAAISDGQKQAVDSVKCAADILPNYPVADSDDALIRDSLIIAFNQFAEGLEDLRQSQLERLSRDESQIPPALALKDAQKLTEIYASSRDASSSIIQTVTLILLKTTSTEDPNAKDTKLLAISCAEKADILDRVKTLTKSPVSPFMQSAALIQGMLTTHTCHQVAPKQ